MKRKYNVNILSPSSIGNLIKELTDYRNSLEGKVRLLVEKLAQEGYEHAIVEISSLDAVFTGELLGSMRVEERGNLYFAIVADSDHAAFVEFGTGIIGKEAPYQGKFPDGVNWQYASGKTIRQLADGRYGWFYKRDGVWYFTEGMPSRPFMYDTAMHLRNRINEIAREVFG